ncbi:phosphotransferase enzyme family protein [Microlunatus soli]|uniref:Ser/Thr protein kinase RdoA involved in Cpx stress response, MazF antagonist n=1 Tax=Microlunatus soli TaxID=630515 RepID=A0A1H1NRT4_9ACTN|nr:phosphotransferase [Microlunatus soli]SDS01692.1 Ser/Thr protein kinase RdoA involved in Cpx stress response, MazF antagonist [Microlunatus soli]
MPTTEQLGPILNDWRTVLGDNATAGAEFEGRELWPVTATDGRCYFLKRLGPWRNLPLADEFRVLRHLAARGILVAEYLITDRARLYAGAIEDSYVLMPRLAESRLDRRAVLALEPVIGAAVADLHAALAGHPWPVASYHEDIVGNLRRELDLPPDLAEAYEARRDRVIDDLTGLPEQLIHGDLTIDNVLLGDVIAFIDLDHLPYGLRLWDLAKYLSRRLRCPASEAAEALPHLSRFLSGYQQRSPLSAAELAAFPSLIIGAGVIEISYLRQVLSGALERRRLPDHERTLWATVEALRWQLDDHDSIAEAVRST